RTFAKRHLQRAHQLVAIERHPPAVALEHRQVAQLHPLEGREAEVAGDADAPAANDRRIFPRPGILDPRIEAGAIRAAHQGMIPKSGCRFSDKIMALCRASLMGYW